MTTHPWSSDAWRQLLVRRENLPQALLLHGPRGIGKLALGRRFAQLILCETAGVHEPCGKCEGCRWFLGGQHPDFRQIEPEVLAVPAEVVDAAPVSSKAAKPSHEIKVDQVRELADFLNIGSHRGRRRLALFHPAEAMNANAANSLLKSLEDPASGACFILISDRYMTLLPTIRSRCISLPVVPPYRKQGLAWLMQEGVENAADWLAFAGGAPLLAQELAGSDKGRLIAELLGLLRNGGKQALEGWAATDREHIEALAEVLQKWAYDKVFGDFSGGGNFLSKSGSKPVMDLVQRREWMEFAVQAGRYRVAAGHPLNPRLFAADLISKVPD